MSDYLSAVSAPSSLPQHAPGLAMTSWADAVLERAAAPYAIGSQHVYASFPCIAPSNAADAALEGAMHAASLTFGGTPPGSPIRCSNLVSSEDDGLELVAAMSAMVTMTWPNCRLPA